MFRPSVSNILLLVQKVSRADKRQTGKRERQDKLLMQSLRRVLCYKQPNTRSERRHSALLYKTSLKNKKKKKKGEREAILLVLLIVASERRKRGED